MRQIQRIKNWTISAKQWAMVKIVTLRHRFKVKKTESIKWLKSVYGNLLNLLFDNYFGVRLIRTWLSIVGYALFCATALWCVFILDAHENTREFLHPERANDMVIGATTILLALMVPVAIVLIEDARKSTLERQVIVKSIIRLGFMPLILLLICAFLFLPAKIHVLGAGITARTLFATSVLCGLLFIFMGFLRAYKWLSDGSTFSSGMPDSPSPDNPQPEAFSSYRFARIVRLLSGSKSYETWFVIWSQWFPEDYEYVLHQAFFKRENDILNSKRTKRYIVMSLELEAYLKYFDKRNKNSWRFELEYIKSFFHLYGLIENKMEDDRMGMRLAGLWRGENALMSINHQLIDQVFTRDRIWSAFDAMDVYINERGLLKVPKNGLKSDELLSYFVGKYIESLFEDRINTYHAKPYIAQHGHWEITYANLYEHRFSVSFVLVDTFKDWLFNKLDKRKPEDNLFGVDRTLEALFPEADPMILAELFWFLYNAQTTSETEEALSSFYSVRRPFGFVGRVYTSWVEDEGETLNQRYARFRSAQEQAAVKLIAIMYQNYFRSFWNLDELIAVGGKKAKSRKLTAEEKERLVSLVEILKHIKMLYDELTKKQNKKAKL